MSLKVWAISERGDFIKIGESKESATWFGVGEKVKPYLGKSIKNGVEVEVQSEKNAEGKNVAVFIKAIPPTMVTASESTTPPVKKEFVPYGKAPAVNANGSVEPITKGCALNAACVAVAALAGQVDRNNINEMIDIIYEQNVARLVKDIKV